MNAVPRENYGLGSAFKSITKGVKSAVKGAAGAVKDVVKSDAGKLALLAAGGYYLGGGFGPGGFSFSKLPGAGFLKGIPGALKLTEAGKLTGLGKTLGVFAGGSLLGGALSGMPGQDVAEMTDQGRSQQDIESIKIRLTKAYRELGYSEDQIPALVEADLSEYSTRGFADGGRIGFQQGGNFDFNQFLQDRTREAMQVQGIGQAIRPVVESNVRAQAARDLSQAARGGGIESFLRGQLGAYGIIPGMSAMQSPMTGTSNFGRKQVIDALTKSYMNQYNTNYTPASASAPPPSKTPLELKMEANKKIYDEYMLKNSPIPTPGVNTSPPPIFYEDKSLIDRLTALSPEEAFRGETFETLSDVDQYNFAQAFPQFQSQLRDPNYVSSYGPDPIEAFRRRYGLKEGGRIGYEKGTPEMGMMDPKKVKQAQTMIKMGADVSTISSITGLSEAQVNQIQQTQGKANGGRIGYAYGDRAEDNAMQASGVMGLPLNQNPAGVTELDLRDSGGFIPPVGVKEKADDIPAMLSNNEFVFTADAVRGMGDGDVNKGAQRMYDMMKKLENGGRV